MRIFLIGFILMASIYLQSVKAQVDPPIQNCAAVVIQDFSATKSTVKAGEKFTVSWDVIGARYVDVTFVGEGLPLVGSSLVSSTRVGEFDVVLITHKQGCINKTSRITIVVTL